MDYHRIYTNLIDRARVRTKGPEHDMHHVLPRCMGGDDESSNLVPLTRREHFIAHLLLTRIYPEVKKLWMAAFLMSHEKVTGLKVSSRTYEKLRAKNSTARKGYSHSLETRAKIAAAHRGKSKPYAPGRVAAMKGKKHGPAVGEKISAALTGKPKSAEHNRKVSEALKARIAAGLRVGNGGWEKGKPRSPETIEKMRAAHIGRVHSEGERAKRAEAMKKIWDDPEYRANQSAKRKAAWERRKAKKEQS